MNLLSYRSAFFLGLIALSARAFGAAFIDSTELVNAGWVGILLAGIMYLPVLFSICTLIRFNKEATPLEIMTMCLGKRGMQVGVLLLFAGALYGSADVSRVLMTTLIYGTQEVYTNTAATLPSLIAAASAVCAGAGAIGGIAGIWIYCVPLLLAIVVGVHIPAYSPGYLFPIWGAGWTEIFSGSLKILGIFSFFSVLWLVQSGRQITGSQKVVYAPSRLFLYLFFAIVVGTAVLAALASMLTPQTFSGTQSREYRLSMLLSNGLSPTFLQFPYVLLWYGSLMISQGFLLFAAARLLTMAFPRLPFHWTVWGCTIIAAVLAALRVAEQNISAVLAPYITVINSIPLIVAAIAARYRRGGKHAHP